MIRFATTGTSDITRHFIEAVRTSEGVSVTTVYSRDRERAERFAADTGVESATDDLNRALQSSSVDALYVASPNSVHGPQVKAALTAGRHVLVEKPATTTSAEFSALVELAVEHGVVLMEGMRNVHDPNLREVSTAVDDIGPIRSASFWISQRSARYDDVLAGRRVNIFDPQLGGGALRDLGSYALSAAVSLLGVPEITVGSSLVRLPGGADGAGAALLQYPGFPATITFSKITAADQGIVIRGERGSVAVDSVTQPVNVSVTKDGSTVALRGEDVGYNLRYEIEHFAHLVATADPGCAVVDTDRTLAVLTLIDEIARTASWSDVISAGTPRSGTGM